MKKILLVVLTFVAFVLCGCNQSESNSKGNNSKSEYETIIPYREINPNAKTRGNEVEGTYKINYVENGEIVKTIYYDKVILHDLTDTNIYYIIKYNFDDITYKLQKYEINSSNKEFPTNIYQKGFGSMVVEIKQYEKYFEISYLICFINGNTDIVNQSFDNYEIKTYTFSNNTMEYIIN